MLGAVGWGIQAWSMITLRELRIAYERQLIDKWDVQAPLLQVNHLQSELILAVLTLGKHRPRPKSISEFHPYRKNESKKSHSITHENFQSLRYLFGNYKNARPAENPCEDNVLRPKDHSEQLG